MAIASCANFPIKKVVLTHEPEGVLMATVAFDAPEAVQFAFYVLRNEKRIHVQWYSPNPVLRFGIKAEQGLYRVLAFLRAPNGTFVTKHSNPVFLYPAIRTLEHAFKKPQPEERALLLQGQNWKFPALYYAGKKQQPLFVMLSAAIDRSKTTLPVFNRWTWADKFPGHVLCVADPTLELHDDLALGWYLGTAEHDASEELASFIRGFAEGCGIPEEEIVIWGSSGGGFGALALASRIEKATAVAINAQTDIFAYASAKSVENVRRHCFGNKTTREIQDQYGPRINMAQAWINNRNSRAILIQNTLDAHHYECHFKPFWEALGGATEGGAASGGRHYAWLYNGSRGHVAEPQEMLPEILSLINQDSFTESSVMPTFRAANE